MTPHHAAPALDFYQDLHRAFDATLRARAGRRDLVDAVWAQAVDSFNGNVAIQGEGEPALACRRGCATCCTLRVGASAPEVWQVARFLRAVAPPLAERGIDLIGRIRASDARAGGLDEPQRVALRQFCPFIAQGVCVIYAVRPLACRGHASHDLKACVDAAGGRREDVPVSQAHRTVRSLVQNALLSSLRDAGLAWAVYELGRAVLIALDAADAEHAWLGGADPLRAAALTELSAAEMGSAFDQLRPAASAGASIRPKPAEDPP